jgi:hypothetical protein
MRSTHLRIIYLCGHDDTRLFLSFSAADFAKFAYTVSLVLILEQTIYVYNAYNWMSSNFLSLNPAKTEFLNLIGLPQQLSKLSNPV